MRSVMTTTMSSPQIALRCAAPGDESALASLFEEDMRELGEEVSVERLARLASQVVASAAGEGVAQAGCVCMVACMGEEASVVGVLLANASWSPKFGGRALWIESLYVSQKARRRGLGRLLVEALLDWAEAHEIAGIDIEAYRGNTPAGVLYRSLGFRRLGRERFSYTL